MYGWMSDEVDESDGVMYSLDEARWKGSRLLQEHEMLLIAVPWTADLELTSVSELLWLAAVRSQ